MPIIEKNGDILNIENNGSFHNAIFYYSLNDESIATSYSKVDENLPDWVKTEIEIYNNIAENCIKNAFSAKGYK